MSSTGGPSALDQITFKEMGLLSWLVVDLAINWAGWAVSAVLKTDKLFDMLGTGSFLVLSVASAAAAGARAPRQIAATAMAAAWALRLGGFLVARVWKVGHDSRFDERKHQPLTFWVYWTIQAVWVFVTLSPVLLVTTATAGGPARLLWSDVVGPAVWALGFTIEAVADAQKFKFKMDPANKGRFIDEGLWRFARYPNYFGEMALWWGMFIFCSGALRGAQFASVVSPLFVMALLFGLSGIPPQVRRLGVGCVEQLVAGHRGMQTSFARMLFLLKQTHAHHRHRHRHRRHDHVADNKTNRRRRPSGAGATPPSTRSTAAAPTCWSPCRSARAARRARRSDLRPAGWLLVVPAAALCGGVGIGPVVCPLLLTVQNAGAHAM